MTPNCQVTSKTLWIRIFLAVLVLAVLAAGALVIYRVGYARGVAAEQSVSGEKGKGIPGWRNLPAQNPHFGLEPVPGKGRANGAFPVPAKNGHNRLGGFSLFGGLLRLAVLGLAVWLVYKFFRGIPGGMGWQLTFQRVPSPASEPAASQPPADENVSP